VPWWTLRSEQLSEQVQYPATSSPDEWANELLHLDQLLVEGFEEKWLRQKAQERGRRVERQYRSLRLVEECLISLDFEEDHARKVMSPLHEVHTLRSKLKGHATGTEAVSIKQKVLKEHRSYRAHFQILCAACDESIRAITEAFTTIE
jgi:hypothetical protein